jgi:hypothetical protein
MMISPGTPRIQRSSGSMSPPFLAKTAGCGVTATASGRREGVQSRFRKRRAGMTDREVGEANTITTAAP